MRRFQRTLKSTLSAVCNEVNCPNWHHHQTNLQHDGHDEKYYDKDDDDGYEDEEEDEDDENIEQNLLQELSTEYDDGEEEDEEDEEDENNEQNLPASPLPPVYSGRRQASGD